LLRLKPWCAVCYAFRFVLLWLCCAGTGSRATVFLFNDTQIKWDGMVEDINNLLNSGEVPNLFATDEKAEILEKTQNVAKTAGMAIKDWGPNETFAYFVEVRCPALRAGLCC
jgi:dynein heavy chain